jgi:hypothetical protein
MYVGGEVKANSSVAGQYIGEPVLIDWHFAGLESSNPRRVDIYANHRVP